MKKTFKNIFDRVRLKPVQIRAVAEQRFGDAVALQKTGENDRANGAIYLAGYVVECLLKAKLMEKYPFLKTASDPEKLSSKEDKQKWFLCFAKHDLGTILELLLPSIQERMKQISKSKKIRLLQDLKMVCSEWSTSVRYSTQKVNKRIAFDFIEKVKEIRKWLI